MLSLFTRNPGFRTLWGINLASSMVGWSLGIALAVHIYQLTSSAIWTAILAAMPTVSGVLFGHTAGVAADRWNPRRIVQVALKLRVVVLLAMFVVADSAIALACVVFVQATIQQLYIPAEQVLIASYVKRADLAEANGLNSFASNSTRLVAPALGGFVILWAGFQWTAIGMAALMLASAAVSLLLPPADTKSDSSSERDEERLEPHSFRAVLRQSKRVQGLVLIQVVDAIKEGPLTALFPVLMLGVIGATSGEMGLANSAFAGTAVIAGPFVGIVTRRLGFRLPIVLGAAVANCLIVALAIWPSVPMALVAFLLSGLPFTISWVGSQTWLILSVRQAVRGRVVGSTGAVYAGASLATTLGAGVLAEQFGTRWVLGVSASIAVAALFIVDVLVRQEGGESQAAY